MKDKFKMVGTNIEDFSLPNTQGGTTKISDLRGKNVVIALMRYLQ
ncbi:MAG: redoxin domain-containing protein [archaeon]|nr:redoxin domain-containing protein [archaeon]